MPRPPESPPGPGAGSDAEALRSALSEAALRLGRRVRLRAVPLGPGPVAREARARLRRGLVRELEGLFGAGSAPPGLEEPGGRPRHPGAAVSLSHCPSLGAVLISPGAGAPVGLDVELAARARGRAVRRVSTAAEARDAPLEALLWPAKEAAVKSAPPGFRALLPRCAVSGWRPLPVPGAWSFRYSLGAPPGGAPPGGGAPSGEGVAALRRSLVGACAFLS